MNMDQKKNCIKNWNDHNTIMENKENPEIHLWKKKKNLCNDHLKFFKAYVWYSCYFHYFHNLNVYTLPWS